MLGISCVAAQLAASQEGIRSMSDDDGELPTGKQQLPLF
jgi:hypothetical protein